MILLVLPWLDDFNKESTLTCHLTRLRRFSPKCTASFPLKNASLCEVNSNQTHGHRISHQDRKLKVIRIPGHQ